MKGMKAPDTIKVERNGIDEYSAEWTDDTFRYHVWIGRNRKILDRWHGRTIFKNRIDNTHRNTIHLHLEAHPAIEQAIANLPTSAFDFADRQRADKEAAEEAKQREDAIVRLHEFAAALGYKVVPIDA